jgi:hypothetical protein
MRIVYKTWSKATRSELLRASREAPAALLVEGALSPGNGRVVMQLLLQGLR